MRLAVVTITALLGAAGTALAQDTTEPALKGAVVYNLAKFTSWPDDALPANGKFVACVVGSRAVGEALTRIMKDRTVAGHPITVLERKPGEGLLRSCHLVYISASDAKDLASTLVAIRGSPVLSIVEVEDAAMVAGIAQLVVDNGRIRFGVDRVLAKQGRLQLSSRLLSLAMRVRDDVTVMR
jgi:hypothetical protein